MRVDVALLPGQRSDVAQSVCIVVDVLRASSSIVTMLERGCEQVVAAADVGEARRLRQRLPDHLLCGERGSHPLEGFDHGNSPSEFSRMDLSGKSAILTTSNGTRTMVALVSVPAVLVGCLLNRTSVARTALGIAVAGSRDIAVVCAGASGSTEFVLEDGLGAGAIVDALLEANPDAVITDTARFARDAFSRLQPLIGDALRSAHHAQELVDEGLGEDVEYCARLDVSEVVPVLQPGQDGLLVLRNAHLRQT